MSERRLLGDRPDCRHDRAVRRAVARGPAVLLGRGDESHHGRRPARLAGGTHRAWGPRMPVIKGEAAAPTFAGDEVSMGSSPDLDGEYVVLEVPGAGLTVIWTWSDPRGPAVLAESRATSMRCGS